MKSFLLAAFVLCRLAPGVHAEELKILRVGVAPVSPPLQYVDNKSKLVGLEVDFANQLGQELGRKIQFVELKFGKLIPALLASDIDIIMSGMSITQVRSLQIAFSDPYLQIGQMPLVRLEDSKKFVLPLDVIMTDKKVGAAENTTSQYLVVQEFPNAKKTFFSNKDAAVSALKNKKIDVLILDSQYVSWLSMKNEGQVAAVPIFLTQEQLAWGVRKNDQDLLESVNVALAKWKETGQLNTTIKKWIPGLN